MTSLFGRSLGLVPTKDFQRACTDWRVKDLTPAHWTRFDGSLRDHPAQRGGESTASAPDLPLAHAAGVNCLTNGRTHSRFLLSGGADATIKIWDLAQEGDPWSPTVHQPVGNIAKSNHGHNFGISQLCFHPTDSLSFISSSYDKTVRVWNTETLQSTSSFAFPGQVYAQDISPFANHRIAAALQDSFVRLIDLRIGDSTHTLPGHEGAVLSVAWSPLHENILVSAGSDGTVRLWDVRTSRHVLGALDNEDTTGVLGSGTETREIASERQRFDCKAHIGPCNGVIFSTDGSHIISCGHDERIRVWDASTGANTLVHFGPTIRNRVLASITPALIPRDMTHSGHELMLFPNGAEVLILDIHEGTLLRRLRPVPGIASRAKGENALKQRVTGVCWRPGDCGAYSSHSTGLIKSWIPHTKEESADEDEELHGRVTESEEQPSRSGTVDRKRRRLELQELYRDLTKQKLTFT